MKHCTITLCDKKHYGKGYCSMHYTRMLRHSNPNHLERVWSDGRSKHPLWRTYNNMKSRCVLPTHPRFKDYGGRGIDVNMSWLGVNGFYRFLEDMGERPNGYTLERIDNELGYSASNCKWATRLEQAKNKREYPKNRQQYKNRVEPKRDKLTGRILPKE